MVAAAGLLPNTCVIKRSTDGGISWNTVYTDTTRICFSNTILPVPPQLYCVENDAYCVFWDSSNAASVTTLFSADEGFSWSEGVTFAYVSADTRSWGMLTADGSQGIMTKGVNSLSGAPFGIKGGNDFVATPTYVTATNKNCRPLIRNETGLRVICAPNAGGNPYTYVNVDGIPFDVNTFIVPEIGPSTISLGPLIQMFNESVGYMLMINTAGTRLNFFVTTDEWVSLIKAATITPATTPLISFCCTGNFMRWEIDFILVAVE